MAGLERPGQCYGIKMLEDGVAPGQGMTRVCEHVLYRRSRDEIVPYFGALCCKVRIRRLARCQLSPNLNHFKLPKALSPTPVMEFGAL
jgi:hypothetical protein